MKNSSLFGPRPRSKWDELGSIIELILIILFIYLLLSSAGDIARHDEDGYYDFQQRLEETRR